VIGALLAMHHVKANRGTGQFIDVALYEAVFGIMESLIPEYAMFEHVRERTGSSLPGISPSNTYLCADGNYVIIAGNGDGIFKRLMQAIGLPEFAEDARFADNAKRVQHNDLLDGVIGEWTARHPIDAVLQVLEQADVPSGRIYTAADIARDPQYAARGMIERHTLPDGQPIDLPGIVPKLSATPGSTRWVGPELGEHTDEVLHALGLDAAALDSLRAEGII
jgi:formyl-CoA transferase